METSSESLLDEDDTELAGDAGFPGVMFIFVSEMKNINVKCLNLQPPLNEYPQFLVGLAVAVSGITKN